MQNCHKELVVGHLGWEIFHYPSLGIYEIISPWRQSMYVNKILEHSAQTIIFEAKDNLRLYVYPRSQSTFSESMLKHSLDKPKEEKEEKDTILTQTLISLCLHGSNNPCVNLFTLNKELRPQIYLDIFKKSIVPYLPKDSYIKILQGNEDVSNMVSYLPGFKTHPYTGPITRYLPIYHSVDLIYGKEYLLTMFELSK